MENEQTSQKSNRLTKKQALCLIVIGLMIDLPIRNMASSDLITTIIGSMAEITYIYAFISLFTKKGLRWR